MNIKSLLLGSAAAMVAVSSAQAADAVVVEAEPVEYVRVCDMYGAGYFYIPGTETCLKLSGNVRVQYTADSFHNERRNNISNHDATVRARLYFDAKSETEYGTLGTSVMIQGSRSDSAVHDIFSTSEGLSSSFSLGKATINLAGFRTGVDTDAGGAWNRYAGYGFYNARNDGFYGFQSAIFFEYGGSAGDFNYVVGIQDSAQSGSSGAPDPYVAVNTTFGGLSLQAAAIYDGGSDLIILGTNFGTQDGGVAYRVRADYDLSSMLPGASIGAWWEADDGKTDYVKGHKWGVTMKAQLVEKVELFVGYSEYARFVDLSVAGGGGASEINLSHATQWTAGVRWRLVENLYIQPEYSKTNITQTGAGVLLDGAAVASDRFTLRIVRSF